MEGHLKKGLGLRSSKRVGEASSEYQQARRGRRGVSLESRRGGGGGGGDCSCALERRDSLSSCFVTFLLEAKAGSTGVGEEPFLETPPRAWSQRGPATGRGRPGVGRPTGMMTSGAVLVVTYISEFERGSLLLTAE